jgi:hypothetical protein
MSVIVQRLHDLSLDLGLAPTYVGCQAELLATANLTVDQCSTKVRALADAMYSRSLGDSPEPTPVVAPAKPKTEKKPKLDSKRIQIFGFAPVAILRWMGANQFDKDSALRALAALGAGHISPITASIQLRDGRIGAGQRGEVPQLTDAQAKQIRQAGK